MTELHSDRRRRLMRDELRAIAIELFAERGYDQVTVDDIAEAGGISARTFFRYFATKEEVVLAYERRLHERLLAAMRERPAGEGGVEALREAYIATSHVVPAERAKVLLLGRILTRASSLRARALGERLSEDQPLISDVARRLGIEIDDPRARVVVTAMGAVAVREFRAWVDENGKGDPAERISAALAMIEHGLSDLDTALRRGRNK